jgi:hypothetical protein
VKDRVERYARGYAQIVALQRSFASILAAHGIDRSMPTFEADMLVAKDVAELATKRAQDEGADLASVARALLFVAALNAEPDPAYDPARRPPFRPRTVRARLRFWVPRAPYDEAKQMIIASRRSVSHALEDELRIYAHGD